MTTKVPIGFDESTLSKLTEPITVTVRKEVAGQKMPITLPLKPGQTVSGKGLTADDVRQLDKALAENISGGGMYHNQAVGANNQQMKWTCYFPESDYPELINGVPRAAPAIPAAMAPGMAPGMAGPPPQWLQQPFAGHQPPAPAPGRYPSYFGAAAPQGAFGAPGASPYGPAGYGLPPYGSPFAQMSPFGQASPFGQPAAPAGANQEREERMKLQATMERRDLENAYEKRMGELTSEMRQLQQSMAQPQQSEEVTLLRQQLAAMDKRQSEDKFATALAETNRANQDLIKEMRADSDRRFETLQRSIESSKGSGPDPTMVMLMESQKVVAASQAEGQRLQIDAQREQARLQVDAQKAQQQQQIGPTQLVDILTRFNSGHENQIDVMGKSWEMMMAAVDTMMGAQAPAPHPALDLLGQAAQGGMQVLGQMAQSKEVEAQAAARTAQAQAQLASQQMAYQHQQQQQLQSSANANTGVAEGAAMPGGESQEGEAADAAPEVEVVDEVEVLDTEPREPTPEEIAQAEHEMFGVALPAIHNLRTGVAEGHLDAEQCAGAIVQGIDAFVKQKANVPAFDLWAQGDLPKLLDLMLPEASTSMKEQIIAVLFEWQQAQKTGNG